MSFSGVIFSARNTHALRLGISRESKIDLENKAGLTIYDSEVAMELFPVGVTSAYCLVF